MSRTAGYVSGITTQFIPAGSGYGEATGGTSLGTRTVGGLNYAVLQFTSTSQLTIVKAGLFDIMLFAGGGGGGNQSAEHSGGGGGGGGCRQATVFLNSNITITIGAGADASLSTSVPGIGNPSYTSDNMIYANGGGTGGMYDWARINQFAASAGGQNTNGSFGSTVWANGFSGGSRSNDGNVWAAGGGAGVGGAGVGAYLVNNQVRGGQGGIGLDVSTFIGGSLLSKGGGGGGGGHYAGEGGEGGGNGGTPTARTSTSGGSGGKSNGNGSAAPANSAGGGGGCGRFSATSYNTGGSGGSGIGYVRFRIYT